MVDNKIFIFGSATASGTRSTSLTGDNVIHIFGSNKGITKTESTPISGQNIISVSDGYVLPK